MVSAPSTTSPGSRRASALSRARRSTIAAGPSPGSGDSSVSGGRIENSRPSSPSRRRRRGDEEASTSDGGIGRGSETDRVTDSSRRGSGRRRRAGGLRLRSRDRRASRRPARRLVGEQVLGAQLGANRFVDRAELVGARDPEGAAAGLARQAVEQHAGLRELARHVQADAVDRDAGAARVLEDLVDAVAAARIDEVGQHDDGALAAHAGEIVQGVGEGIVKVGLALGPDRGQAAGENLDVVGEPGREPGRRRRR